MEVGDSLALEFIFDSKYAYYDSIHAIFLANLWEKIKSSEFLGGDFTVLSLLFL